MRHFHLDFHGREMRAKLYWGLTIRLLYELQNSELNCSLQV